MVAIQASPLPEESLMTRYRLAGAYTDCYRASLPQRVSPAEFVEAFCTGWLFKVERLILAVFLSKSSSDQQAKHLAEAKTEHFAAWRVEGRTSNQLLLVFGNTRSWLMCAEGAEGSAETHFYFGSAVVPRLDLASGRQRFGVAFHLLGGLHRLYSRALLRQALSRLTRRARKAGSMKTAKRGPVAGVGAFASAMVRDRPAAMMRLSPSRETGRQMLRKHRGSREDGRD